MRIVRLKRAALKLAQMPRDAKKVMYRALANVLREEISKIKRESRQEYLSISQKCHRRQWVDWLRHQAGRGNADALAALRRRKPARDATVDSITGSVLLQRSASGRRHDSVTKQGTIIYRVGASAVRDDGDVLRVSCGAELDAMQVALQVALERFGKRITVNGSETFKEQVIIAATTGNLPIVFDDPELERRRLRLTDPTTTRANPIHDVGTCSPAARAGEGPGPVTTRNIHTPNPSTPQKPKSAEHVRSLR